jgi:hypothetical protein
MNSLYDQIREYALTIDDNEKNKSMTDIKKNILFKNLSRYVKGGISGMKKEDAINIVNKFKNYDLNRYFLEEKEIFPDDQQMEVIKAPYDRNIRVIAGAGTGKTTTIICRIKELLDHVVTPDRILVLTFNVEARKNLEIMIGRMMGFDIKIEIRTIDSFCRKIIQDFMIEMRNNVYNYALAELGTFGKMVMEKYGEHICRNYEYVFFDEFQDVDDQQFNILKYFADHHCKVTVIGDDSQNIYQFRGSDNYYIINFDRIFKNVLTYKITTNYRSRQDIINLANHSITHNTDRIHKEMIPCEKNKLNGTIDLTVLYGKNSQVNHIIEKINYYLSIGVSYDDIAILSRTKTYLMAMETEMQKLNVPFCALIDDKVGESDKQIIIKGNIVISTIHKAKGLEWKVVFIVGLCDEHFPSQLNNNLKNIQEERRLFYVGATRAKEKLHFVGNSSEISLSRFLHEVIDHIEIKKMGKSKSEDELFCYSNGNNMQTKYSVMDIVEMLNGSKLNCMRDDKLLPNVEPTSTDIFKDKLTLTDELKTNALESDFGIFCDNYMTRKLQLNNNQDIRLSSVENILFSIHLSDNEKDLYEKYDLEKYFSTGAYPKVAKEDVKNINILIAKLISVSNDMQIVNVGKTQDFMKHIPSRISDFHYPSSFLKRLLEAYIKYVNKEFKNDDILEDIYFVSLCLKFNFDRRRLVYRNVYDLFIKNFNDVKKRIDDYCDSIKNNDTLCKINVNKSYKISDNNIKLCGEIDYINVTSKTLVDIKCSESDYKVEWFVQLLSYYALFNHDSYKVGSRPHRVEIDNVGIFNPITGKYIEIKIPEDYNWDALLEYYGQLIGDSLDGTRTVNHDYMFIDNLIDNDYVIGNENNGKTVISTPIVIDNTIEKIGYMSLDIENNTTTGDIVQLSYIIYHVDDANVIDADVKKLIKDLENIKLNDSIDDKHDKFIEIKKVNKYIKDHVIDKRGSDITKITNDMLISKGDTFESVITEFAKDIVGVKYLIGHNISSDIDKIKKNIAKHKIIFSSNIFNDIEIHDTMVLYKKITGKLYKLNDMYKELYNKDINDAHDSLTDALHTWKCYIKIFKSHTSNINDANDNKNNDDKNDDKKVVKNVTKKIVKKKMTIANNNNINNTVNTVNIVNNMNTVKNDTINITSSRNMFLKNNTRKTLNENIFSKSTDNNQNKTIVKKKQTKILFADDNNDTDDAYQGSTLSSNFMKQFVF